MIVPPTAELATAPPPRSAGRESASVPWLDVSLGVAAGGVALHALAVFWKGNPDYNFAWGVPFLAAYLLAERWARRPARHARPLSRAALIFAAIPLGLMLLVARLLAETEPGWRPGLWLTMSLYISAVLVWFWLYGGGAWLRHFFFPVAFLFLAVPWPFNLEYPIVQGLMHGNALLVAGSLVLADIPAHATGNLIALPVGQLGVEEACSGIRSLQAVLMMSLFLGEFYHLPRWKRAVLPLLAVLLALAGNYARLLFLAWQAARHGLPSVAALHESAGLGILVFTVLGLWLVCLGWGEGEPLPAQPENFPLQSDALQNRSAALARRWAVALLLACLLSEGFTQGWYAWREKTAPRFPSWTIAWPPNFPQVKSLPVSPATHALLQDDASRTGTWTDPRGWKWQALWFQYRPRAANKIVFDSHNPEICLTAAGLNEIQDSGEFPHEVRGLALRIHGYLFAPPAGSPPEYVFWITYRNRGNMPEFTQRQGVYGQSFAAFLARSSAWFQDAWEGCRGTDAQTLEVALTGPPGEPEARRAYLDFLDRAIVPETTPAAVPPGG